MDRLSALKAYLLSVLVLLSACAGKEELRPEEAAYRTMARSRTVRVVDQGFVNVRRLPLDDEHAPLLDSPVTLRTRGATLEEVCEMLMRLSPVQVNVVREGEMKAPNPAPADPELMRLFPEKGENSSFQLTLHHEGPLRVLLDQIAAQTGLGWDFDRKTSTITLASQMVKVFQLMAPPGRVALNNRLTNQNREQETRGSMGGKVETVAAPSTSSQIAQQYEGKLAFDTFEDTLESVKAMLSPKGEVRGNASAGTILVRDRPEQLRQIARYIREVNASFQKQVAMKVNVYSLEVEDETKAGLNFALLWPKLSVHSGAMALSAGALSQSLSTTGTAQATILEGSFKGSQAMLRALKSLGRARQITSAGIVALNNQPAPVEAIQKTSYLAGISHETTDHGSETSLTPGEVTTGFSMTITPHILSGRRLLLQYTVHLSNLDSLESFESQEARIQLPRVSTRAFAQKAAMQMGQTLVLAGFQQASSGEEKRLGILGFGGEKHVSSSLIIITIEVENAAPELAWQN